MSGLVLSLFPGVGLLDRAFEEEGFCVVRGPDVLWGGDVFRFHPPPGRFDGLIGGPPCQTFSSLANLVRAMGREPRFGNLIPEFERCVREAQPAWFLMENVRAAPPATVEGYDAHTFLWNNAWTGEPQSRLRRFTFGARTGAGLDLRRWIRPAALEAMESAVALVRHPVLHRERERARVKTSAVVADLRATPVRIGGSGKVKKNTVTSNVGGNSYRRTRYTIGEACELQGLPADFLEDAPFTAEGKLKAIANGVPLALGRAIAGAVRQALAQPLPLAGGGG